MVRAIISGQMALHTFIAIHLSKLQREIFKPGECGLLCAWFLEIALVHTSVCVSVCVSAPEGINNQWRDMV